MSDTGQPTYFSMELTVSYTGETSGATLVDPQNYLLDHTVDADNPAHSTFDVVGIQLRVMNQSALEAEVSSFPIPRADNPIGAYQKMGFGCERVLSSFDVEFEWPTALVTPDAEHHSEYELHELVGAKGTARRTLADGGYYQGTAKIVKVTLAPESPAEPTTGVMTVQFVGGSRTDPTYTAPAVPIP